MNHLTALKQYGTGDPSMDQLKSLEALMYNGSDRGAAVVLGAAAEKAVEALLRKKMRSDGVNELFDHSGAVGTFSAKTQVAYAFKLIGPKTRSDLTIIRHVRNQFAHSRMPITFTTQAVKNTCAHLQLPDLPGVHLNFRMLNGVSNRRLRAASDKTHPRTRYFTSCNEIAQRIYYIRTGDPDDPLNQLP